MCCWSQTFSEQFDVHSAVLESTKRARDVDHDEKKRKKLEVNVLLCQYSVDLTPRLQKKEKKKLKKDKKKSAKLTLKSVP